VTLNAAVRVVVNPVAGGGRAARILPHVRAVFARQGVSSFVETRAPGDEGRIVDEAVAGGIGTLVAVGGDGTWSNLADAILRSRAAVRLALVPAGSGNDLAKGLGIRGDDIEAWAHVALEGRPRRIDVGCVEGRHFVNALGFGLDVTVLEAMLRVRRLRGEWAYLYCAARSLLSCRAFRATIAAGESVGWSRDLLMLVVANGPTFGGGFRVAPQADVSDGQLDLVAFDDARWARRALLMHRVRQGTHRACPEVTVERAPSFRLSFAAPPSYEVDGELRRASSAELEVTTAVGALQILTPAGAA
jgi:YegS/Rv2252/BmrU family lipid kinase